MIIERTQKRVLLEEAARKGVTVRRIQDIPEFYRELLGQTDVGQQALGFPLTSIYRAQSGEVIDVPKIAKFFQGLLRDVRVLDLAMTEMENDLTMVGIQFWSRMQLAKNRAREVRLQVEAEKARAQFGARWAFSESFSTTQYLDMVRTTAWIDTSQGVAFLPNQGMDQTVVPQAITVLGQSIPQDGSFLGSMPAYAFDGLENTNWRANFIRANTQAQCTIQFPVTNINSLVVDPVGYGILFVVEMESEGVWQPLLRDYVYGKKTLVFDAKKVSKMRFSFEPLDASFPRTAGIRGITLFSSQPSPKASVYTVNLRPQYNFNELKLDIKATVPSGAKISTYWASASGGPWNPFNYGDWVAVSRSNTSTLQISSASLDRQGALYVFHSTQPAISNLQGKLYVGLSQVEVSAFRKDWAAESESPRSLVPQDFLRNTIIKTWTNPTRYTQYFASYPRLLQGYGLTTLSSAPAYITRGKSVVALRKTTDHLYTDLNIVPFSGAADTNCLQPNYNYRFRTWVHCGRDTFYDQGKYWFLQGHRVPGTRTYRDLGRSYGAVTVYVNNNLVISDNQPRTVYTDNTMEEGAANGNSFSIKFNRGWNVVDILINVLDTTVLIPDNNDSVYPYLQFTMTPTVFDSDWQQLMSINQVVGSGEQTPVSEFDLVWNLPQDPTYWAWSEDLQGVMFNTSTVRAIDSFLKGVYPTNLLTYMGINASQEITDLYLRLDMDRDERSLTGPTLDDYKVLVR